MNVNKVWFETGNKQICDNFVEAIAPLMPDYIVDGKPRPWEICSGIEVSNFYFRLQLQGSNGFVEQVTKCPGSDWNIFWVKYFNSTSGLVWNWGVLIETPDDNLAVQLKLMMP